MREEFGSLGCRIPQVNNLNRDKIIMPPALIDFWKGLTRHEKICYSIFIIFFVAYIGTLKLRPYPFSYIVKIIPILSLAFTAFKSIPGLKGKLIVIGLLFSAIGDVFLAIDGNSYFVQGLSAFGAAHVMYTFALARNPKFQKSRILIFTFFILYGIGIWLILYPSLGKMLTPVTIYVLLITLMGISSVIGKENHWLVIIGAGLFILSDSFIAFNMFISRIPNSSYWIMLTYYPAQFLITYGGARARTKRF